MGLTSDFTIQNLLRHYSKLSRPEIGMFVCKHHNRQAVRLNKYPIDSSRGSNKLSRLLEKEKKPRNNEKTISLMVPFISSLPSKEAVDSLVRNGGEVSTRGGQGLAPAGVTSVHNIYTEHTCS